MEREFKRIIVVDESDSNPRAVTFDQAVANNWIRRSSRIFVVNKSGEVLIQRRSKHISKPLLLDNSAAGHVDEGEEYIDAAIRELYEELGIEATAEDFEIIPPVRETNFFSQIHILRVNNDVSITIDPYETEEYFWLNPNEIDSIVGDEPDKCNPALVAVWPLVRVRLTQA